MTAAGTQAAGGDDPLAPLRERFRARSLEQLASLEGELRAGATFAGERERAGVIGTLHRMAGAAGTFGFPLVSARAGAVEDAMLAAPPGTALAGLLAPDLPALRAALETEHGERRA